MEEEEEEEEEALRKYQMHPNWQIRRASVEIQQALQDSRFFAAGSP